MLAIMLAKPTCLIVSFESTGMLGGIFGGIIDDTGKLGSIVDSIGMDDDTDYVNRDHRIIIIATCGVICDG